MADEQRFFRRPNATGWWARWKNGQVVEIFHVDTKAKADQWRWRMKGVGSVYSRIDPGPPPPREIIPCQAVRLKTGDGLDAFVTCRHKNGTIWGYVFYSGAWRLTEWNPSGTTSKVDDSPHFKINPALLDGTDLLEIS